MRNRGIALAATLLLLSVLAVMVLSLIMVARRQSLGAVDHYHRICALNAAEAGLAHALRELGAAPNWHTDLDHVPMPSGRGHYSVAFAPTGGPVLAHHSVNNLDHGAAVEGPRGATGVPPRTAVLIVTGESSGIKSSIEAVIGRASFNGLAAPVMASGPISMRGAVKIDGRESLDGASLEAGLHTNYNGGGSGPSVSWAQDSATDEAVISGDVTTSDVRAENVAISFIGPHSAHDMASHAPVRPLPHFDVPGLVGAQVGGTNPGPLNNGTNVLTGGKYYVTGPLSVAGDLELRDGAELYVEGGLDVNGAIRGKGTVVVNGETHLRGDSQLGADNRLALLSQGDVHLEGFDGQTMLEGLPGGPALLAQVQDALDALDYWSEHSAGPFPTGYTGVLGNLQILDHINHQLGDYSMSWPTFNPAIPQNRLGVLRDLINSQPPSSGMTFLSKKITELAAYHSHGTVSPKAANLQAFLANPSTAIKEAVECLADESATLTPAESEKALKLVGQIARSVSYDKLGSSSFQGLVYTRGDFKATNEVTVVGALVADGVPGKGRITLEHGTSVTYVRDFFETGGGLEVAGQIRVQTWAHR